MEYIFQVCDNGNTYWHSKDWIFHRLDGPAVECLDGPKVWYQYGKRHREDGPAVIYSNGNKEYWYKGTHFSECDSDDMWKRLLKLKAFW